MSAEENKERKPLTNKCMICGRVTWSDYVSPRSDKPAPCIWEPSTEYVSCEEHWSTTATVQLERVIAWKMRNGVTLESSDQEPDGPQFTPDWWL